MGGLITIQAKPLVVNLGNLETAFSAGETINPKTLIERGLIRTRTNMSKAPVVKILGGGELTKKLVITGCSVSESAKVKIEKAGGSIA